MIPKTFGPAGGFRTSLGASHQAVLIRLRFPPHRRDFSAGKNELRARYSWSAARNKKTFKIPGLGRADAPSPEPCDELISVCWVFETPPNKFLVIAVLVSTASALDAALAVEGFNIMERVTEPAVR
jgi:hypothetical protein